MRVALFVTCLGDVFFPHVARATVRVLERLGHEVVFDARQTCCGQMHLNTGYEREAAALMRRFLDVFAGADAVVAPSASCAATVREGYARLARVTGGPSEAEVRAVAARTWDLTGFLTDVLHVTDVGAYFPHRVTYHPTCHSLRSLRYGDRPVRLLRAVRGLELVDLPAAEECCGFGGTFAIKVPEVSTAMAADKVRHVQDTGAQYVCAVDASCLMHIGGALSRLRAGIGTVHIAEVLAAEEG